MIFLRSNIQRGCLPGFCGSEMLRLELSLGEKRFTVYPFIFCAGIFFCQNQCMKAAHTWVVGISILSVIYNIASAGNSSISVVLPTGYQFIYIDLCNNVFTDPGSDWFAYFFIRVSITYGWFGRNNFSHWTMNHYYWTNMSQYQESEWKKTGD